MALISTTTASWADFAAEIAIREHRFEPAELKVPANTAITLTVKNLDPSPAEFESKELDVEKIIVGGGTAIIRIRPLDAGSYPFVEEFNQDTAQGVLIAE